MQQADKAGLKYSSVESELYLGQALAEIHDLPHARQEVDRALLRSDKLGQQALSARAHSLLGTMARETKDSSGARENFLWVVNTVNTMKKDQGAEKLLQREDMKRMYDQAAEGSKGPGM